MWTSTRRAPRSWRATNEMVARALDEVAALLEQQRANRYRVQAWRNGAQVMRALDEPVVRFLRREGVEGLDRLPGIGPALARAVRELATTGRLALLDRLRGGSDIEGLLASVPGIGETLAHRLHEAHGIDTLEALERAAHDGTLEKVPGFGARRVAAVRDVLAHRLAHRRRAARPPVLPPIEELLDVDREYREGAAAGTLPRIAPRRFNPGGAAWLPVLHATRGPRHYTALYSNTARAHQLGRTRDWVVLYVDGDDGEQQYTVVTARPGPLEGRRVVRGREAESLALRVGDEAEAPDAGAARVS